MTTPAGLAGLAKRAFGRKLPRRAAAEKMGVIERWASPTAAAIICRRSDDLVAIPVAAGLFIRWGLDLPMSVGAVAMSLSTIIVAANPSCFAV